MLARIETRRVAFRAMTKYLYLLAVDEDVTEERVRAIEAELGTLFEGATVSAIGKREFKIVTKMDVERAAQALRAFTSKFGPAEFKAGGQID